jgi:hypothetical protein
MPLLDTDVAHTVRRKIAGVFAIVLAFGTGATAVATVDATLRAAPAGATTYLGSAARLSLVRPIVDMASTPTGKGYWLVASDGGIFSYGDAHFHGSTGGKPLNKPIVGMTSTRDGGGYWFVASDGGIFSFGDAHFHGSTGAKHLNKPIVGMAATPTGRGYWLVASDGGIFTFGDARFFGSTGGRVLNKPIVGMAPTATGRGYYLVASDGGLFTFGDAHFYGSTGGRHLVEPIVGMTARHGGGGYWLLARDGSVFPFGSAHFFGSAAGAMAGQQAVGLDAAPKNDAYWVASQWGGVDTGNSTGMHMDPNLVPRTGEGAVMNEMIRRINTERLARRLHALYSDPVLAFMAANWAHYLAGNRQFKHQDLGTIMSLGAGRFEEVGENLFGGSGPGAIDAGTAHVSLMHSDGHRANILLPEEQLVGVGVACMNGELIVVEDFATPAGVPMLPHGTPPLNPIASSNEGGSSC